MKEVRSVNRAIRRGRMKIGFNKLTKHIEYWLRTNRGRWVLYY